MRKWAGGKITKTNTTTPLQTRITCNNKNKCVPSKSVLLLPLMRFTGAEAAAVALLFIRVCRRRNTYVCMFVYIILYIFITYIFSVIYLYAYCVNIYYSILYTYVHIYLDMNMKFPVSTVEQPIWHSVQNIRLKIQ